MNILFNEITLIIDKASIATIRLEWGDKVEENAAERIEGILVRETILPSRGRGSRIKSRKKVIEDSRFLTCNLQIFPIIYMIYFYN